VVTLDEVGHCKGCGRGLLPEKQWLAIPLAVRRRIRKGWARHVSRGLCMNCYAKALADDTLLDHPRAYNQRDEMLEEVQHLREAGESWPEVARRLGVKQQSLAKNFARWRQQGHTDIYVPYSWAEQRQSA
jgi:hypothetical protein